MGTPPMDSRNEWARLNRRLETLARELAELRSATGTLDAATIVDRETGARLTLNAAQLKMWPNYGSSPEVFSLFQTDWTASRMSRWFGPAADAFRAANSISIQGAAAGTPGNIWIYTDGRAQINAEGGIDLVTGGSLRIYDLPTTGSAANLRLDAAGGSPVIYYVTSSQRYKEDVADAVIDPVEVLQLRPRTWVDKGTIDRLGEAGEEVDVARNVGFIAEEVDELPSMRQFVDYDDEGRPDAIQYDRLTVAMYGLAVAQQAQLDAQADQLAALTARLDALEASTP